MPSEVLKMQSGEYDICCILYIENRDYKGVFDLSVSENAPGVGGAACS